MIFSRVVVVLSLIMNIVVVVLRNDKNSTDHFKWGSMYTVLTLCDLHIGQ